jgi:serine-type D-Ala-D-Ala carboxypeptidase (penicillin-binding protein 5/6)
VQRRTSDSRAMLNWGFRFFETHRLYTVGNAIQTARIWEGVTDTVDLGPERDVVITLPRGEYDNLEAEMSFNDGVVAPVSRGDVLGEVVVNLNGETLATTPVIALADVEQAGFFSRMSDRVLQWFEG